MDEIVAIQNLGFDFIDRIEDRSGLSMQRMRIYFKNGFYLSIVRGTDELDPFLGLISFGSSYGYEEGLFEIAVRDYIHDPEGVFTPLFWEEEDQGDDVLGHCDYQKVLHYIKKVGMYAND